MKGVSYITDSNKRIKAVQIELSLIEKYEEHIEDLLDLILVEARRDEEMIPFDEAVKKIRKSRRK
jgi:hypothetical protein